LKSVLLIALLGKGLWAKKVPAYGIHKMKGGNGCGDYLFFVWRRNVPQPLSEVDVQRKE